MSKKGTLRLAFTGMLLMVMSHQAMAAFTLGGTRFIYQEGAKSIAVEVTNNAEETFGGQVWVSNASQDKNAVFMVPSPPFFKLAAKKKQIIRLMNVNPALPADQESLFWLNVQEVPPVAKSTDEGKSMLAIAMNTQVKLIYRPKTLVSGREDAEKQIRREVRNGRLILKNPTPYYFAVISVKANGKKLNLSSDIQKKLGEMAPRSEVDIGAAGSGKLTVDAINDWGGIQDYDIP